MMSNLRGSQSNMNVNYDSWLLTAADRKLFLWSNELQMSFPLQELLEYNSKENDGSAMPRFMRV